MNRLLNKVGLKHFANEKKRPLGYPSPPNDIDRNAIEAAIRDRRWITEGWFDMRGALVEHWMDREQAESVVDTYGMRDVTVFPP